LGWARFGFRTGTGFTYGVNRGGPGFFFSGGFTPGGYPGKPGVTRGPGGFKTPPVFNRGGYPGFFTGGGG
jgi:hypothetical protein